jgi:ABC-2 type transport system ATP-binding protein
MLLEVKNIRKQFKDFLAVNDISFVIKSGEIFGFLGPNGAGKTTTINMLIGLAKPTKGKIIYNGDDLTNNIKKAQEFIGIVPDESNLYDEMNGFDNLCFSASLYGIPKKIREKRAEELLKDFALDDTGNKLFKSYSKGMKRKLTIAAGLIHKPKILFLDEPTTGIDIESARQIRTLIKELNQKGTTIFLTTHYIEEAERLCDRIAFIVKGNIVKIGHISQLMEDIQNEHIIQFKTESSIDRQLIENELSKIINFKEILFSNNNTFQIISNSDINILSVMLLLDKHNIRTLESKIIKPSLEEVFVKITGIDKEFMKKEKEGKKK